MPAKRDRYIHPKGRSRGSWSPASTALASVLVATVALACSSTGATSDAPDATAGSSCVTAPSCPDGGVPSYATEVLPIFEQNCIPCHSPSGTAGYDETTYAQIKAQYGSILSQVAICAMPPLNGPQMTEAERVALTAWLKCGAPNN